MRLPYNDNSKILIYYPSKHSETFWAIMLNNEANKQCKVNIYQISTHRTILWRWGCGGGVSATYLSTNCRLFNFIAYFMTFFMKSCML